MITSLLIPLVFHHQITPPGLIGLTPKSSFEIRNNDLSAYLTKRLSDNDRIQFLVSDDGLAAVDALPHRFNLRTGRNEVLSSDTWSVELATEPFRAFFWTSGQKSDPDFVANSKKIRRWRTEGSVGGGLLAASTISKLTFALLLSFKYGLNGTVYRMTKTSPSFLALGEIDFDGRGINPNRSAIWQCNYPQSDPTIFPTSIRYGTNGEILLAASTFETRNGQYLGARPVMFAISKENKFRFYKKSEWSGLKPSKSSRKLDPLSGMMFQTNSIADGMIQDRSLSVRQKYGKPLVPISIPKQLNIVGCCFAKERMFVQTIDMSLPEVKKEIEELGGTYPKGTDLFEVDIIHRKLLSLGKIHVQATSSNGRYWIVTTLKDSKHWFLDMGK